MASDANGPELRSPLTMEIEVPCFTQLITPGGVGVRHFPHFLTKWENLEAVTRDVSASALHNRPLSVTSSLPGITPNAPCEIGPASTPTGGSTTYRDAPKIRVGEVKTWREGLEHSCCANNVCLKSVGRITTYRCPQIYRRPRDVSKHSTEVWLKNGAPLTVAF